MSQMGSYSSKTASGHQLAIAFNFNIELKNVILILFPTFAFLHSQGHKRKVAALRRDVCFTPERWGDRPAQLVDS